MRRRAIVAGATGLVGREVVKLLLDDPDVISVVALTRQPLGIPHPKLSEALIAFEHLDDFASPAVDDYFCCLGTTMRKAGSREAFRRVDFEYPVAIARMALAAGATRCFFVSSAGADPMSRVFYTRTKGELEVEIARLPFRTVVAFRPSLLDGDRAEYRFGERMALAVLRPLSSVVPAKFRPIGSAAVARAMVAAARADEAGRFVVESDAIPGLAAG
jgi:uncharacterized protein YbjT (DUF2867 family)